MSNKKDTFQMIVSIVQGRDFPKTPSLQLVVRASFNGDVVETDPVEHRVQPCFNTELDFEVDRRTLEHCRTIKLVCRSVDPRSQKKLFLGHQELDLGTLEVDDYQEPCWFPLLNKKSKKNNASLLIGLSLERDTRYQTKEAPPPQDVPAPRCRMDVSATRYHFCFPLEFCSHKNLTVPQGLSVFLSANEMVANLRYAATLQDEGLFNVLGTSKINAPEDPPQVETHTHTCTCTQMHAQNHTHTQTPDKQQVDVEKENVQKMEEERVRLIEQVGLEKKQVYNMAVRYVGLMEEMNQEKKKVQKMEEEERVLLIQQEKDKIQKMEEEERVGLIQQLKLEKEKVQKKEEERVLIQQEKEKIQKMEEERVGLIQQVDLEKEKVQKMEEKCVGLMEQVNLEKKKVQKKEEEYLGLNQ